MKCITCNTNPINKRISNNHCSRTCQDLWLRDDLKWLSKETLQRIALTRHSQLRITDKINFELMNPESSH